MTDTDLLLVIDVQNGFVNSKSEHVVEPIANVVEKWLKAGKPMILTRFINDPGSQWERLIHWPRLRESPEIDLHPQIISAIKGSKFAYVIDKRSYSSLTPEVIEILNRYKPKRVILCGIATDGCVLKTAIDLFEQAQTPFVLTDLCASHAGEEMHSAGLLLLEHLIGKDQLGSSDNLDIFC